MPQEYDDPCPSHAPLLVCDCGLVMLECSVPACTYIHEVRTVPACGVCTATGGVPVEGEVW